MVIFRGLTKGTYVRYCERQPEQRSSPYVKTIGDARASRLPDRSNQRKTFAERRRKRHHKGVFNVDLFFFQNK